MDGVSALADHRRDRAPTRPRFSAGHPGDAARRTRRRARGAACPRARSIELRLGDRLVRRREDFGQDAGVDGLGTISGPGSASPRFFFSFAFRHGALVWAAPVDGGLKAHASKYSQRPSLPIPLPLQIVTGCAGIARRPSSSNGNAIASSVVMPGCSITTGWPISVRCVAPARLAIALKPPERLRLAARDQFRGAPWCSNATAHFDPNVAGGAVSGVQAADDIGHGLSPPGLANANRNIFEHQRFQTRPAWYSVTRKSGPLK